MNLTRRIAWNAYLAIFCLTYSLGHNAIITLLPHVAAAGFFLMAMELNLRKRYQWLQYGIATRAFVTSHRKQKSGDSQIFFLTFEYQLTKMQSFSREIRVSQRIYDNYSAGGCFTVLVRKMEPGAGEPYFTFKAVEVEGAPERNLG